MSLTIAGTKTALLPGLTASFMASNGTAPYAYSVVPGGAGGTIDQNGNYTAPPKLGSSPRQYYDQIQVTDGAQSTASVYILVGTPWMLVGEIIVSALYLPLDRLWFWNQKQDMPMDDRIFIAISIPIQKPYSSGSFPSGNPVGQGGPGADQVTKYCAVAATLDLHIYSRGTDALNRLPEVFMALSGPYSQQQQDANGFYLAKLPHNAVDVSDVDGDAIPYHYVVSVDMIYTQTLVIQPDYFGTLPTPQIIYNS